MLMTHEMARTFLQALHRDVSEALSLTADGRYDEAAETLKVAGPDVANVIDALGLLAASDHCRCAMGACEDCTGLDAAEWS
jgi:hypothetical protein